MNRVQEIAEQVRNLSPAELRELRAWMDEHEDQTWDEQFATEVASGKWDARAEKALQDYREARSKPLA